MVCLSRTESYLAAIDRQDRIKHCKVGFETALSAVSGKKNIWTEQLHQKVIHIRMTYFNEVIYI